MRKDKKTKKILEEVTGNLLFKLITNIKNLVTKEHGLTSDVFIMCIIVVLLTILYNIYF